ncbi:IS3 family transposase [Paenibacillus polymyxa]|uniref:IS3 family transposase n=1 Tax=Paenibacillus polymyxa TaxID=1406 RepID=UPI002AB37D7B|nr:IS3 family transposase [Paenibacillus polymyxa]MDY8023695.1 IS3 family transposase [Paenibacillus polymyxa]
MYQWVKKYKEHGPDALQDGRGRKKAKEELTESDRQKLEMKKHNYLAIDSVQLKDSLSVKLLSEVSGIPRSSYYKWLSHKPSLRQQENQRLSQIMFLLYERVGGIYGYRRLTHHLRRQTNQPINHKRVNRLMKLAGIQSVLRRKRKKYARSTPQHTAENVSNRKSRAEAPNEKWLTDITEFRYGSAQKAYLSAILDLHDNTIVSYVLGR